MLIPKRYAYTEIRIDKTSTKNNKIRDFLFEKFAATICPCMSEARSYAYKKRTRVI